MISTKRKKIKNVILFFLIVIVLILLGFTLYYSGYIEVGKNLIKGEKTKKDIIDEIIINDISLNYDSLTNTYYLPIILEENKETKLDIQLQSSYNLSSKIDGREFKKEIEISEIIDYEKTYELDVENFLYKEKYYIKFTNIPSISLNFDEGNASFEYIYSEFLITDPNYKENNTKYQYSDDSEIRYRGSSTGGYPKKGYRIKLEKEPNFGMLGMTKSRKWILDGLVTDSSCLRTKVSSEIWNKMNEDLQKEKHLDLKSEFVEVYINDKYVGLYLLKEAIDEELINKVASLKTVVDEKMNGLKVNEAIEEIMEVLRSCNKYIDETTPWVLAKDETKKDRLATVLYNLLESIRICAILLSPFIPDTSNKILEELNTKETSYDSLDFGKLEENLQLNEPKILFNRIETK